MKSEAVEADFPSGFFSKATVFLEVLCYLFGLQVGAKCLPAQVTNPNIRTKG